MVKKCCVYTYPSESYGSCNISFHSIPKNEEMQKKMAQQYASEAKNSQKLFVCSRHFEPSCFYTSNSRQLLKAGSIPTISPVAKKIEVLSDIKLLQQLPTVRAEEEILRPAISLETAVTAGTSSSYTEEPPWKKLCPNVKVCVQVVQH
ncbi:unnamed protein product [Euphydryas editha]|uniref:THAP-type domain-containing protein n=1 Tax=Euphydryas editha TaxID=104508 RepID=A0AAU9TH11_EUPED|nr:unnamed protein product [Euphydryas editha]